MIIPHPNYIIFATCRYCQNYIFPYSPVPFQSSATGPGLNSSETNHSNKLANAKEPRRLPYVSSVHPFVWPRFSVLLTSLPFFTVMGVFNIQVQIVAANGVGGTLPFVVTCLDNDIEAEIHKTAATDGGRTAVWEDTFTFDLTKLARRLVADGKPEPQYLTFFVFDSGHPDAPCLGSAGVLLSTVRDSGVAQGDFPVMNGTGTLALVVERARRDWLHSDASKIGAAVGVAAVATGITSMAIGNGKKKKKKKATNVAVGLGVGALAAGLTVMAVKNYRKKSAEAAGGGASSALVSRGFGRANYEGENDSPSRSSRMSMWS